MSPPFWIVAAYLLGAVPASYLAGRWTRGIDLRQHGSGNLGATNTFRVLGPRVAAPVMAFDMLKGWLPAWLFPQVDGSLEWRWALAYGAAAILGHVFPVYMGFRGGKGVATGGGAFLALAPVAVGLAFFLWLFAFWRERMVSLASVVAATTLFFAVLLLPNPTEVRVLVAAVAAFVIWGHRSNIGRILRGEEHRFRRREVPEKGRG